MSEAENFDEPAAPVSTGRRIMQFAWLAVTFVIVALCFTQMPAAWLNARRLIDPARFHTKVVDIEVVGRGPVSMTIEYRLPDAGGREVSVRSSGGIIAKYQYDRLAEKAAAEGKRPLLEVVYDTENPRSSCLRDRQNGLPTIGITLLALGLAVWEIVGLLKSFRRE
jgi:hypothetical protein